MITTDLINRAEEDKILNLALLTSEHVLFCGKPGEAKTLQSELFFKKIHGNTFTVALTKFSTEDVLFGPLDIEKMRQGRIEYIYKNTILDSHFALIDEIFDASEVLLRSLLGVLNERRFIKGQFSVNCPLKTAVGTANYLNINEVTEAVVDRFLFQWEILPLEKKYYPELFSWQPSEVKRRTTLKTLDMWRSEVQEIKFPDFLRSIYIDLVDGFGFSTRRVFKGINVVKADAYLNGQNIVRAENLLSLKYLISVDRSESKTAEKQIMELTVVAEEEQAQLERLSEIKSRWYTLHDDDKDGNISQIEHLQCESRLVRSLGKIQLVTPRVQRQLEDIRDELIAHYHHHRERYLRDRGLDA